MIKAVIFDIDNTLYDYTRANETAFEALTRYADQNLGLTPDIFEKLHKKTYEDLKEYMEDVAAVHNRLIRYQNILEDRKLPLHPHVLQMEELYWNTLIDVADPSKGASDIMKLLRERGIRLGIGTDMTARIQFRKLTALGLLPYIDFLVSSEEVGREKPALIFFERCVEKAGCKASECLFVGDNFEKDISGAVNAGLGAVWYCPEGKVKHENTVCITELSELSEIIWKW